MIRWIVVFVIFIGAICEGKLSTQCEHDQFPCNDGSCVHKSWWCDASEDCEDGSDEMYCFLRSSTSRILNLNRCDENFFLCKDGPCIPLVGRCDGYSSCVDNSDEEDCNSTSMINSTRTVDREATVTAHMEAEALGFEVTTSGKINHTKTVTVSNPDHRQSSFSSTQRTVEGNEALKFSKVQSDTRRSLNDSEENWEAKMKKHLDFVHELTSQNKSQIKRKANRVDDRREIETPTAHNSSQTEDALRDEAIQSNAHEDLKQNFIKLDERVFYSERSRAREWLLNAIDENYGWGDETARATIALYMSDDKFKKRQQGQTEQQMLMAKELGLKVFTALMRNQTKEMSLEELALFINALSASCENPRNFHGTDLVAVLRRRTNLAGSSIVVGPFVYLVLCLNNATTSWDIQKMKRFVPNINHNGIIDIDAVASLASTCISRHLKSSRHHIGHQIGQEMAKNLYDKVLHEGLPESIYDLALVAQALNEAEINQDRWNRSEVIKRITDAQKKDGSFGDILSTYYVVPLLSGRSLLSIKAHCDQKEDEGLVAIEVLKNGEDENKYIHYTLYYENPPKTTQTLMLKVKDSCNILDIMRVAETLNPAYKFKSVMRKGKPHVYSLGGVLNDAEKGLYWKLHISSSGRAPDTLVPFESDIRSLVPGDGNVLVFWYKSAF